MDAETKVGSALTAEEWAEVRRGVDYLRAEFGADSVYSVGPGDPDTARVMAVVNSCAGPDGGPLFTWEDVDFLNDEMLNVDAGSCFDTPEWALHLASLRDRIASLLPPREP